MDWLKEIFWAVIGAFRQKRGRNEPKPVEIPSIPESPKPVSLPPEPPKPIEPEKPKYEWDTQAKARHSVRVICDEEGLSLEWKNILTACVMQESQMMNYYLSGPLKGKPVKNENIKEGAVWSTDWGICQINDTRGWHIGPGLFFSSVQDVLDNPDKAVRYMARMFKAGKANLWSSYKFGAYEKYL